MRGTTTEVRKAISRLRPEDRSRLVARFNKYVNRKPTSRGCLIWTGGKSGGYGDIYVCGYVQLAHRLAWILAGRPLRNNDCVLHECDNPLCVNVDHLWLGDRVANNLDRVKKNRSGKSWKTGLPYGVSAHLTSGRYRSHVGWNKKIIYLGYYDTPEEAHRVAIKKRAELLRSVP